MPKFGIYAVIRGHNPGIYDTWCAVGFRSLRTLSIALTDCPYATRDHALTHHSHSGITASPKYRAFRAHTFANVPVWKRRSIFSGRQVRVAHQDWAVCSAFIVICYGSGQAIMEEFPVMNGSARRENYGSWVVSSAARTGLHGLRCTPMGLAEEIQVWCL